MNVIMNDTLMIYDKHVDAGDDGEGDIHFKRIKNHDYKDSVVVAQYVNSPLCCI